MTALHSIVTSQPAEEAENLTALLRRHPSLPMTSPFHVDDVIEEIRDLNEFCVDFGDDKDILLQKVELEPKTLKICCKTVIKIAIKSPILPNINELPLPDDIKRFVGDF